MTFEIMFISVLVLLQIYFFVSVLNKIKKFRSFFPFSYKEISIKSFSISKAILNDSTLFDEYLNNIGEDTAYLINEEDSENVELLVVPTITKNHRQDFNEIIKSTNAYLCKNKGASADFNILQDICERHLQKRDNEISNLINVPLYIGLAGTFVGIIIGLWGIDFTATTEGTTTTISSSSISQLLNGVIAAMAASFVGLCFTVWNTAMAYKPAVYQNDTDKNHYYDFIQRELLPYLNEGVAGTLGSFRDVLNQFIRKFGENMNDYKESGELLNENLQKQQTVLEEINKLSLTKTSQKIVEVFANLKDSAEHLEKFQGYQRGLNEYVDRTEKVAEDINTTIEEFKDFSTNLKAISTNTLSTIELQKQFKDSLEKHFPTISDHREVWRQQIDELNADIKEVYKQLTEYFKTSTGQIQTFIANNQNLFTGTNELHDTLKAFVDIASIQKKEFDFIKKELIDLRNDYKSAQTQTMETNLALIEAIRDLKITISKIEIITEK
jgi:hypothetical protein